MLDDWKARNKRLASKKITPYISVVPRFYTKMYRIIDHEESILYYYTFQETKNINFSKRSIYNDTPKFLKLIYKASIYGKNIACPNIRQLTICIILLPALPVILLAIIMQLYATIISPIAAS